METGRTAHTIKANFKPSSSNEVLSYATMPRGGDKKDLDFQRWRNVEENNNENAFSSYKGLFIKSFNEWKVCISQVLDVVTSRMQKFCLDSQ